ncbi:CPBP family intramembrane glutamic endopeptidase [Thermobispora bispora]|uniref:Abortive infection protein n=1 Tax=Thermobispora bispora (strain ATCC 19993 / DSM 43833 / CBS 139.67 / JCM 10125 / KCTC 9307 / NBRC 14880 / R51) TaxID=469371 RepID=D6YAE4_THEBD|nr:type II CAAX endopeptidase family protein [Thermobispora bispora]MBO2473254.1 CPBP family intramembrane metalloprotease [Actinomycetales bacterium]MDI9580675.1 type II CAAX endopeptidase family protein [Thermobispora sp.]ADG90197.1 Abortive infection protein [Thermobispora bispora DSM 43833]MBX6167757.1 CPBP family intramembrane metalloprotease [Thermobispora bispora]QSI46632.1 CPBP family intramembrane metalloprotease [Thermobispora bispora]
MNDDPSRPAATVVGGGPAGLTRRLIAAELVVVFGVSLGASALIALIRFIGALTAPDELPGQRAVVVGSLAPGRPWLDLALHVASILINLAPVGLVAYLLVRSGESLRTLGVDAREPGRDLARGAVLAAAIGGSGLVFYIAAVRSGINLTVVPDALPDVWWRVPVLLAEAAQNGVLEEVLVAGYLLHRLAQCGWHPWRAVAVSAVLRGSYHFYQGLGGFLGNVAMGVVFGRLYQRWGRAMPLVVAHTLIDVVAFVGYGLVRGKVDWLP